MGRVAKPPPGRLAAPGKGEGRVRPLGPPTPGMPPPGEGIGDGLVVATPPEPVGGRSEPTPGRVWNEGRVEGEGVAIDGMLGRVVALGSDGRERFGRCRSPLGRWNDGRWNDGDGRVIACGRLLVPCGREMPGPGEGRVCGTCGRAMAEGCGRGEGIGRAVGICI